MSAYIIGAGVTGLAAGIVSGAPVFEQATGPGGICRSYYMRPGDPQRLDSSPPDEDAFRFEVGGGHWIFGRDESVLEWVRDLAPLGAYERQASIRLADGTTIPYPLQGHVELLGPELAGRIAAEQRTTSSEPGELRTLTAWLEHSFGPTLCELFFYPFHDRYAAGLAGIVAPQDDYKSPPPSRLSQSGHAGETGYNAVFHYPEGGLDRLMSAMADACDVRYHRQVIAIDRHDRVLRFADGTEHAYETVISTLPLHQAVALAGAEVGAPPDPFTSVLVLNVGAERGDRCPDTHWQYEAETAAGFHRIGFYSNIDRSFLPRRHRHDGRSVALYVERAFLGGVTPDEAEMADYTRATLTELRRRGYIGEVQALDASWVEVTYTWQVAGSRWRDEAIGVLAADGIHQAGRYGRWHFQGIADSVREGLDVGAWLTAHGSASLSASVPADARMA